MKTNFLFPQKIRPIGWMLLSIGFVMGYLVLYQDFRIEALTFGPSKSGLAAFVNPELNFTDEIALTLCFTGLLFVAFAKLKEEDEYIAKIRLDALHWAVFYNYMLVIVLILINNLFGPMITKREAIFTPWAMLFDLNWLIYTLFTPLILFITRLFYSLSRHKKGKSPQNKIFYLPARKFLQPIGIALTLLCGAIWIIAIIEMISSILIPFLTERWLAISWYLWPFALILWIFSKQKKEDEYIQKLRLDSWHLTFYIHYALLLIMTWAIYGLEYLTVLYLAMPMMPHIFFILFYSKKAIVSRS